ncbi:FAD-binding oxidoreductase [Thermobifida alba]|uniref:FAD-binding oxidoreductase n=1 Tax=Thermobifida alba TaxID=53522 RepID=A0ABY4L912_THEAE|nr:FAD-binding oxidoreductase [Thermobifida alba]UPT22592.1 FAD-binding oxidoreductase [Thermobifida alba]HLU97808.1 FAD-binding oxidoreductase [Thermobifida alba]
MTRLTGTTLTGTALTELRTGFSGRVLDPGDPDYAQARTVFNTMIDLRPTVIAQCATVDDVARAVRFGRDHGLEIAVRGGGHSVAGSALTDGGIVVDLRMMNEVTVDPEQRTARVGGGATMSHLDRATQPYGLATTGGRVSTTGVCGLVLGGGSGWLERRFGLACDHLLEAELVTADGDLVRASATENPELFWALHGGGGNFGIATSITLRLHELSTVTVDLLFWDAEDGPEVVRAYRDFMGASTDDVGGAVIYLTAPPEEFVPPRLVGRLACAALVIHTGGDHEEAMRDIRPMRELDHVAEVTAEMAYADLQCMLDDPPGYRNYWSAEHLNALPDAAVDRFCSGGERMLVPSPSQYLLAAQGGAVSRTTTDYPVPWRHAAWVVHPFGMWEDPADDERAIQWAHSTRADMSPWAIGSVYLNFIGDEGEQRTVAGFGLDNYRRLARVKARYDPDNVFHRNHNIKPA